MDTGESVWHTRENAPRPEKRPKVQVSSKQQTLKVMALTRYHFIAGMPHSGARTLTRLLSQNPRFSATQDGPAAQIFAHLRSQDAGQLRGLEAGTKLALLRGAFDAAHHARPLDSVVLDGNDAWLDHFEATANVLPLARFIIMVRDPAAIAADMAQDSGALRAPKALLASDGPIGRPLAQIEAALAGPEAERLLLIDYDRFLSDPDRVLTALYGVLREPIFAHDLRDLPQPSTAMPALQAPRRRVLSMTGRASPRPALPLWQRSSGTAATLLLREAG